MEYIGGLCTWLYLAQGLFGNRLCPLRKLPNSRAVTVVFFKPRHSVISLMSVMCVFDKNITSTKCFICSDHESDHELKTVEEITD